MSIIIEDNKVIKATGDINQIISDFNEYLDFVLDEFVPKEQFDAIEKRISELEEYQSQALSSELTETLKDKAGIDIRSDCTKDDIIKALLQQYTHDVTDLNHEISLQKICIEELKSKNERRNNNLNKPKDNVPYKRGDLAFIIRREWSDHPLDDNAIIHITLAVYNGFSWRSLTDNMVETKFAEIVPIHNTGYLRDYFYKGNVLNNVRFHYY